MRMVNITNIARYSDTLNGGLHGPGSPVGSALNVLPPAYPVTFVWSSGTDWGGRGKSGKSGKPRSKAGRKNPGKPMSKKSVPDIIVTMDPTSLADDWMVKLNVWLAGNTRRAG